MASPKLKVLAFNCSLKSAHAREKSSTDALLKQLLDELAGHGAKGEVIRAVDFEIKPGVSSDEGANDAWPQLRQRVIDSDIVIIATPIWLGQPSSVAKRVLERMDAFLDETDKQGRMPSYGKVALAVVVGNEDGVAPGPVWTPLNPADKPPQAVAKFGSETPMQRPAQPEEIAPAFVFLAAPARATSPARSCRSSEAIWVVESV
jgi:multimeric flavodoxin WrbA